MATIDDPMPWWARGTEAGEPFEPMQPRGGPSPLSFNTPDPSYYIAPPQEQVPDDIFTRLARSQGPTPFNFRPRRDARGIDVILAALAGFANARTAGAARGAADVDQRNRQRSEGAKLMAEERWRQAKARQEQLQAQRREATQQALEAGREDRFTRGLAAMGERQDKGIAAQGERTDKMIGSLERRAGVGGQGGQGDLDAQAEPWVQRILEGGSEVVSQIPAYPKGLRTRAVQLAQETGGPILPKKARDTINELNAARVIVNQLRAMNEKLDQHRGEGGLKRLTSGLKLSAQAFSQAPGIGEDAALYESQLESMLANIARSRGERGVLTNQDIDRVKKSVPDLWVARGLSKKQFDVADQVFNDIETRIIRTYSQRIAEGGAGLGGAGVASGQSTGQPIRWVMDAQGNFVREGR